MRWPSGGGKFQEEMSPSAGGCERAAGLRSGRRPADGEHASCLLRLCLWRPVTFASAASPTSVLRSGVLPFLRPRDDAHLGPLGVLRSSALLFSPGVVGDARVVVVMVVGESGEANDGGDSALPESCPNIAPGVEIRP